MINIIYISTALNSGVESDEGEIETTLSTPLIAPDHPVAFSDVHTDSPPEQSVKDESALRIAVQVGTYNLLTLMEQEGMHEPTLLNMGRCLGHIR